MYALLAAAARYLIGTLVTQIVIKFVLFTALYVFVSEATEVMISWLPSISNLDGALGALTPEIAFFLNLLNFQQGLSVIISAQALAFAIRRIPLMG